MGVRLTACPDDLFSHAGIPLWTASARARAIAVHCLPSGRFLAVYSCTPSDAQPNPTSLPDVNQLCLPLGDSRISTLVPSTCRLFLNARLRTLFNETALLRRAVAHLIGQGLLYVGDLVPLGHHELLPRLGRHARALPALESKLAMMGLTLASVAPWWHRPGNYYRLQR